MSVADAGNDVRDRTGTRLPPCWKTALRRFQKRVMKTLREVA